MSVNNPELEDFVRLFQKYGRDLGSIYQVEDKEDPYAFLFEQIIKMLIRPSPFNLFLPELFCTTAHRYHGGDVDTLAHLGNADNRHFMLCDLHDFIMLKGGLKLKRKLEQEGTK